MEVDYRQESLAAWEASAAGWAHWSRRLAEASQDVSDWLVEKVDPQPGQTVLELAAGSGETGYQAARLLGPDGRLISSDFSPLMLEEARRRAEELGVENVEFRVVDAERIELGDDSVDGVLCRYGYMLMADPAAALRETQRVLRPGGRVAFAVWTGPERNPWALFGRLLVERGALPPPEPGTPGLFALSDPKLVEELLNGAGFREVEIEELDFAWDFPGLGAYWDFVVRAAGAVAGIIAAMSAEELADYRRELGDRAAPFLRPDGELAFPASSLNVAASAS